MTLNDTFCGICGRAYDGLGYHDCNEASDLERLQRERDELRAEVERLRREVVMLRRKVNPDALEDDSMAGYEGALAIERAEVDRLRRFVGDLLRETCWGFEPDNLDGADLQERALKAGIIVPVPGGFDPEKHGDGDVDPGDPWYTLSWEVGS